MWFFPIRHICKNTVRSSARHDQTLPIEDLCKTAFSLLKFGGKFYVVYSAARSCELIHTLIENNLEPKRMFFTENGKGKVILVIIEAVKANMAWKYSLVLLQMIRAESI